ncbi:MAG: Cell shape-determining protein MreC precursor [candidate division WS2 bacterium ADurb.Bin280]|uniref:Cell shape-determining protein MreC n=1 Tax=candidate division WS2 bacterium ADurb.Bin280 TaxID=1852829 RepID=A0A1V5SDJ2_9BACT|nr:MAG: Cell shape-determining protein MreC precursor [candidate division WS2 bacterium ADurb.Bin280]
MLFILYRIWSLPFEIFTSKVILPSSRVVADTVDRALYPIRFIGELNLLYKKNKELEAQNAQLKSQIVAMQERDVLNQQVLSEQNLDLNYEKLFARIISRTPQNFNRSIIVDKGSSDGVKVSDAVLSNGFLIGQVKKVEEKTSEVVLITNHNYLTPSILDTSRETGMIQGSLEGLVMTDVPAWVEVSLGEKVLTSGLGGDLPKGLLIGEVAESKKGTGLFQDIKIKSPFALSGVEVITILANEQ